MVLDMNITFVSMFDEDSNSDNTSLTPTLKWPSSDRRSCTLSRTLFPIHLQFPINSNLSELTKIPVNSHLKINSEILNYSIADLIQKHSQDGLCPRRNHSCNSFSLISVSFSLSCRIKIQSWTMPQSTVPVTKIRYNEAARKKCILSNETTLTWRNSLSHSSSSRSTSSECRLRSTITTLWRGPCRLRCQFPTRIKLWAISSHRWTTSWMLVRQSQALDIVN